ncbi:hypothetical protein B0H11DRAFT_2231544 [Mycena galericulata]|nr:hypothetical protein B0H11DRAFT_2231544 [Mycena galericulata]
MPSLRRIPFDAIRIFSPIPIDDVAARAPLLLARAAIQTPTPTRALARTCVAAAVTVSFLRIVIRAHAFLVDRTAFTAQRDVHGGGRIHGWRSSYSLTKYAYSACPSPPTSPSHALRATEPDGSAAGVLCYMLLAVAARPPKSLPDRVPESPPQYSNTSPVQSLT